MMTRTEHAVIELVNLKRRERDLALIYQREKAANTVRWEILVDKRKDVSAAQTELTLAVAAEARYEDKD